MTTRSRILNRPLLVPMLAAVLFTSQLAFGNSLSQINKPVTDQVIINADAETTMVLTQRSQDPSRFGTLADLWDLQLADQAGEVAGGTFVTAFRQGDLLILRQVSGDKKITIDFSAEHAYVDRGDKAVETYSDIELITSSDDEMNGYALL